MRRMYWKTSTLPIQAQTGQWFLFWRRKVFFNSSHFFASQTASIRPLWILGCGSTTICSIVFPWFRGIWLRSKSLPRIANYRKSPSCLLLPTLHMTHPYETCRIKAINGENWDVFHQHFAFPPSLPPFVIHEALMSAHSFRGSNDLGSKMHGRKASKINENHLAPRMQTISSRIFVKYSSWLPKNRNPIFWVSKGEGLFTVPPNLGIPPKKKTRVW